MLVYVCVASVLACVCECVSVCLLWRRWIDHKHKITDSKMSILCFILLFLQSLYTCIYVCVSVSVCVRIYVNIF